MHIQCSVCFASCQHLLFEQVLCFYHLLRHAHETNNSSRKLLLDDPTKEIWMIKEKEGILLVSLLFVSRF